MNQESDHSFSSFYTLEKYSQLPGANFGEYKKSILFSYQK